MYRSPTLPPIQRPQTETGVPSGIVPWSPGAKDTFCGDIMAALLRFRKEILQVITTYYEERGSVSNAVNKGGPIKATATAYMEGVQEKLRAIGFQAEG